MAPFDFPRCLAIILGTCAAPRRGSPLHLRRHQFPLHRRGHNPMAVNREQ
jgi:hypothetical protein